MLHEGGHVLVAQSLGYETQLHFAGMTWGAPNHPASKWDEVLIVAGGPVQSILTGTLGLILVWRWRRDRLQVLATPVALFWSRPVANLIASAAGFGGIADEVLVANFFQLPSQSLQMATGLFGFGICGVVIGLQPLSRRIPMLVGGAVGSVLGGIIWFSALGPRLLPI